jgi:predicted membrane protein (TIGR00267 family)
MKRVRRLLRENRLYLVVGLCDGILSALTLAAGRLIQADSALSIGLALRVAVAGASSAAFMLFVAHYSELRAELFEAERQLNLTSHGQMAASRLGRVVLLESGTAALIGCIAGFCGSLLPLVVGVMVPSAPWLSIVVALTVLAVLGVSLARAASGQPIQWAFALIVGGGILAYLGTYLRLI